MNGLNLTTHQSGAKAAGRLVLLDPKASFVVQGPFMPTFPSSPHLPVPMAIASAAKSGPYHGDIVLFQLVFGPNWFDPGQTNPVGIMTRNGDKKVWLGRLYLFIYTRYLYLSIFQQRDSPLAHMEKLKRLLKRKSPQRTCKVDPVRTLARSEHVMSQVSVLFPLAARRAILSMKASWQESRMAATPVFCSNHNIS